MILACPHCEQPINVTVFGGGGARPLDADAAHADKPVHTWKVPPGVHDVNVTLIPGSQEGPGSVAIAHAEPDDRYEGPFSATEYSVPDGLPYRCPNCVHLGEPVCEHERPS